MTTTISKTTLQMEVQVNAFKSAATIVCAIHECDPELREVALELFQQLAGDDLDHEQKIATTALIVEILFPNTDDRGVPGLDREEAEKIAPAIDPDAGPLLADMDQQEATFAERLRHLMEKQGITQSQLAEKVGIGQPAISMMLNRVCRPQRKTVQRIATALSVTPEELWPVAKK